MNNYIHTHKHENSLSLTLDVGANKVYVIGEKMNKIHEMAYMNGYNWSAFLDFYLKKNHPDVLVNMKNDSEAGTFVAYCDRTDENQKRVDQLAEIITELIENESQLYEVLQNHGDEIEWD